MKPQEPGTLKRNRKSILIAGILIVFTSTLYGYEFQVRLSGGLNYLGLKDVNSALRGWEDGLRREAVRQSWKTEGGAVPEFHGGFEFQAELIFLLTPRLGIGLGSGYIHKETLEKDAALTIVKGTVTYLYARLTKVSAVPLDLTAYYFIPLGRDFHIYLKAGAGYLNARYVDREANKKIEDSRYVYPTLAFAKAGGPSFQGGVGLAYQIEPFMGFFLEAAWRLARPGSFTGENKAGEQGTLYYFEEYNPDLDFWQARMQVLPQPPAGERIRSAGKAVIDLSGASVRVGISLKF